METLKKPEMLVSGTSLAVSISVAIYLNRRVSVLEAELGAMSSHLSTTIQQVGSGDKDNSIRQLAAAIKSINSSVQEHDINMEDILNVLESQSDAISEIQDILEQDGKKISVKLASLPDHGISYPRRRRRNRAGGRRGRRVTFDPTEDLEDSDDVREQMKHVRNLRRGDD